MMLLGFTYAIRISDSETLLWYGFCLNLLFQIFVNMPIPGYQALLYCFTLVALYLKVTLNNPQGKTHMLHFMVY
jgi:hypothetical protein